MKHLTDQQLHTFREQGYIIIPKVFEENVALQMQDEIWVELNEEFGIDKNDPATWRTPPHSPRNTKFSKTNEKVINEKFRGIIDELLGKGNWKEPNSWGGFLITFPTDKNEDWNLKKKLWHWDYELFRLFELRGLVIFSFFSEVVPKGGGTLVVPGSHRALEKYYHRLSPKQKKMKHGDQRKHFMKTHPFFKEMIHPEGTEKPAAFFMEKETTIEGVALKVIELTGNPGDAVFCHPRLIHAPAAINHSDYPRFMRGKFLWQ